MAGNITRGLAVVGAATLLVLGFDAATYAATGSSLILGKSNSAGAVTKISRTTAGPVLTLQAATSSSAPFTTNATGMVTNLNANKVGGSTAAQLVAKASPQTTVYQDTATSRPGDTSYDIAVAAGTYLITFNANMHLDDGGANGTPTDPNTISCYLFDADHDWGQTTVNDTGFGWFIAPSFSTVYTAATAMTVTLECDTTRGSGWAAPSPGFGPRVSFTKIAAATQQTLS